MSNSSSLSIGGVSSSLALIDSLSLPVFEDVTISDTYGASSLTASVSLSSMSEGMLDLTSMQEQATGLGVSVSTTNGVTTLIGSATALQAALRLLRFQPSEGKAGVEVSDSVSLSISNGTTTANIIENLNVAGTSQAPTTSVTGGNTTVFIGGASEMQTLESTSVTAPMLADGNIALYGHTNGVFSMVVAGQMAALTSDWKGSAVGVAELGGDQGLALGQVTVTNTTTGTLIVPVGQDFAGSNGLTYVLVAAPGQPGIDGPGETMTNGYVSGGANLAASVYKLAPGQTVTLNLEAGSFGSSYNLPANSIVSSGMTGLVVDSSSPINGAPAWTNPADAGVGTTANPGFLSGAPGQIERLEHDQGFMADEANVNLSSDNAWTTNDIASWTGYVAAAHAEGILNVAPIWSANGLDVDYSQPFSTSGYFAPVRQAALIGGGLAFDSPPWFFNNFTTSWFSAFGRNASDYQNLIEQQIRWCNSEGIRSSVIISPNSSDNGSSSSPVWDNNLLEDTEAMVATLRAAGALPSQFIVENYTGSGGSNSASANDPNGLNAVALYLSTVATVSTTSESGLEVPGKAPVDMEMNGIVSAASLGASITATPYSQAIVGTTPSAGQMTLTIKLSANGTLSDAAGTVSSDGLVVTVTGDANAIQLALNDLQVSNKSPVASSAQLSVTLADASGIAQGSTTLTLAASDQSATVSDGNVTVPAAGQVDTPSPNYSINGSVYVVGADPNATATINLSTASGKTTVFGGNASLNLSGGNSTVILNGQNQNGTVSIASTGNNQVWLGTAPVAYQSGGASEFILGSTAGQNAKLTLSGTSTSATNEILSWGASGDTETVLDQSAAPSTVFGGLGALSFTGGSAVLVDNGAGDSGALSITSKGNDMIWGGSATTVLQAGGGDTVVGGSGSTVVHGTALNVGTETYLGWANAGSVEVDGGAENEDVGIWNGQATVYAGTGTQTLSLNDAGRLVVVSSETSGGEQDVSVAAKSTGSLQYWGGGSRAVLTLGAGDAIVKAGSGNFTLTGGAGSLNLDLSSARSAVLNLNGKTAGNADVWGFSPSTTQVTIDNVVGRDLTTSGLVFSLSDGHTIVFHDITNQSGIHVV